MPHEQIKDSYHIADGGAGDTRPAASAGLNRGWSGKPHERIRELEREVAHWKANHRCEVDRARVLKERPDMPLERVKAYEQLKKLQSEVERLTAECDTLNRDVSLLLSDNTQLLERAQFAEAECDRYKAEGSAADFACHLINNCERETITEEFIQQALVAFAKKAVRP